MREPNQPDAPELISRIGALSTRNAASRLAEFFAVTSCRGPRPLFA